MKGASTFKTCKYRPDYPYKGFLSIAKARDWVLKFSHWCNVNHKHSGLKFVTPHQRQAGLANKCWQREKTYIKKLRIKIQSDGAEKSATGSWSTKYT